MKHLTPVAFTFDGSSAPSSSNNKKQSESAKKMCPSCKKELSNSIRIFRKSIVGGGEFCTKFVLIVIKPCSHIICKTCMDSLVTPSSQCVACDGPAKPKDIVELAREGQLNRISESI